MKTTMWERKRIPFVCAPTKGGCWNEQHNHNIVLWPVLVDAIFCDTLRVF